MFLVFHLFVFNLRYYNILNKYFDILKFCWCIGLGLDWGMLVLWAIVALRVGGPLTINNND